jgi:hypothetical protein
MSEISFQKQAELWGKTYEILVKRGVLACLVEKHLLNANHPGLSLWKETKLMKVSSSLVRELDILDDRERELVKASFDHLSLMAFGLGYTAMREYLKPLDRPLTRKKLTLRGLWCPLTLPSDDTNAQAAREANVAAFCSAFNLQGIPAGNLFGKGLPANADFILWLSGEAKEEHILIQEYSFDMPGEMGDFRDQGAHLDELLRYRRFVDSRGVFAKVVAEVDGESFELSDDIRNHLTALTSDNKPFYKLCQACSYSESFVRLLRNLKLLDKPVIARALAITPNGLESLAARFDTDGVAETRVGLMEQMGAAYRKAEKLPDGDEEGLTRKVDAVFTSIRRKLPHALQKGMRDLATPPKPGQDYVFEFEEWIPSFANPMQKFAIDEVSSMIDETRQLSEFFGGSARAAIGTAMEGIVNKDGTLSLRDIHAAAVVAGMRRSVPGRINVIALEGNPGIGKTTAVRRYLGAKEDGYLFLYVSPRVVINRDVTESLARRDGKPTGILTLTSNAQINASARRYHDDKVRKGLATKRIVDGAVIADGVGDLATPRGGSILVLTPEEETEIDSAHAGATLSKATVSEFEDLVKDEHRIGVLSGLAQMTHELLGLNPALNRVVLTAALQGFRERAGGKTTIDALSKLFINKADSIAGEKERKAFAQRIPNVVVMVDELAGDGAGAPFVHAVARWLTAEFIESFEAEPSPFTVTLIVSDASLGNEVVLARYLGAGERSPDKVLISKSVGERCFRVAATDVQIGGAPRPTLHVMTNSFPASKLHIRYNV